MIDETGHGGEEHLAPVTDLFARRSSSGNAGPASDDARSVDTPTYDAPAAIEGEGDGDWAMPADEPRGFLDGEPVGGWQLDTDPHVDSDGWWIPPVVADGGWEAAEPPASAADEPSAVERSHAPVARTERPEGPSVEADANVVRLFGEHAGRRSRPPRSSAPTPARTSDSAPDDIPQGSSGVPGLIRASDLVADGVSAGGSPREAVSLPWSHRAGGEGDVGVRDESGAGAGAAEGGSRRAPRLRVVNDGFRGETADEPEPVSDAEEFARGERALLKKLRGKGISVSEARAYLRGIDVPPAIIDDLVDLFLDRRYLDDAVLAEQLVHIALTRKAQGRRAIAQALSARGIERDVIEEALSEIDDDDDGERALEFARSKARSMSSLDREVALRRLLGQLARRGFGGSTAMAAAKTALDEVTGVRFR